METTSIHTRIGARAFAAIFLSLLGCLFLSQQASAQTPTQDKPQQKESSTSHSIIAAPPTCGPIWNLVSGVNSEDGGTVLRGVAAVAVDDVWAVGNDSNGGLIEHWDGSEWSIVPFAGPNFSKLNAVTALTANDIWAVGLYTLNRTWWTLTMHWDGTSWTHVPSPTINPGHANNELLAVAAISPNDVWAVGYQVSLTMEAERHVVVLHWQGTEWKVVPTPSLGFSFEELRGVTAVASDDVWAVGAAGTFPRVRTLTLHWDGVEWTRILSPNVGSGGNFLFGVDAISSTDVWAVGTYDDGMFNTLIQHWDGTSWTVVDSPDQIGDNVLYSISAGLAGELQVVGTYDDGYNGFLTLTLHKNAAGWHLGSSPNLTGENFLLAADSLPGGGTWAVGAHDADNDQEALIQQAGQFSDIQPADYFFTPVSALANSGAASGYDDCTFRPWSNTTRAQLSKIVVLAYGLPTYVPPSPSFSDVPAESTFYRYIETAHHNGLVFGYDDGTFRPGNDVTRGQLSKIIVLAKEWELYTPPTPTFGDVPVNDTYFQYIETAYAHGIISGYEDRTFRPGNSATRGQISKIVYLGSRQP